MLVCIVNIEVCVDTFDVRNLHVTLEGSSQSGLSESLAPRVCKLSCRAAMDGLVPNIQVAFENDMYWSMPPGLSAHLYKEMCQPIVKDWELAYTWSWGKEGEVASCNRYVIDVE